MPEIELSDVTIRYEVLGEGPRIVLTPGGRFSMDIGGVRELGHALTGLGFSVLLWDRPNCGSSSISFAGDSESSLWADTLAELLRAVQYHPASLIGGSAGARVSLLTAVRQPELVSSLYMWWISGGTYALMNLGVYYVGELLLAAVHHGMEAVADLGAWRQAIKHDPANRERILALDRDEFIARMQLWINHYIPMSDSPVPGMSPSDYATIEVPVCVLRSGSTDLHHPRETSEWVHRLIPGSQLVDPPWPDNDWNRRAVIALKGESPFEGWPELAPGIAAFIHDHVHP